MRVPSNKASLQRWCIWFLVGNVILFWLISLNYLPTVPWVNTCRITSYGRMVVKIFTGLSFVGYLGFLALIPYLILSPLALAYPKRLFIFITGIVITTLLATLLLIDTVTYQLYRYHLNGVIISLIVNGLGKDVLGLSQTEYIRGACIVTGICLLECIYATFVWRYIVNKQKFLGYLKWFFAFVFLSLYISFSMLVYSANLIVNRLLADVVRVLPLYTDVFGAIMPIKDGHIIFERLAEGHVIQPNRVNAPLNYPLHAIQYTKPERPLNLVVIVIDAWRFDMLNKQVTPNLSAFAKKAWVFNNHFSGGNATGPGVFSLFYGLPAAYWTAMEDQRRGPLLLDEMIKRHYQMGIFGSAPLTLPPFNQTVFVAIKNLQYRTPGTNPYERDLAITGRFKKFIVGAVKQPKPFFSFLFYDAAHSYCSYDKNYLPFVPVEKKCNRISLGSTSNPIPYLNRYKNGLVIIDQQIKQVLETLKANQLLDNTIVIVTGDHGEEFNDNHTGYWSHASNFTHFQTQTPLIVYWPKQKPKTYSHQTSHFDVVPTLMEKMLGSNSPYSDYSVGKSLQDQAAVPYLVLGSYVSTGILEPDRITDIYSSGYYRIEQLNGELYSGAKLSKLVMQKAFLDMRKFYKP